MSISHRLPFLALALAASLLVAACSADAPPRGGAPHDGPTSDLVLTAQVIEATRAEQTRHVTLHGIVEAERTATVSTRVLATVTAVHADVGDLVKVGATLLTIDPTAAQGQVSQARGALAQARAALALAERNLRRFEALAAKEAASALELDQARMQHSQALGAVEQAEGALAAAQAVADDARVAAPFAGRVARRMVDVGDLAAPGRPLLELEGVSGRRLAVAVPESTAAAAALAIGHSIDITLDARPSLGAVTGTVVEVAPGADPHSHAIAVEVALPVELAEIPTGGAGRASLEVGTRAAITVPRDAVVRHGGLEMVVLDVDGHAETRAVTTGRPTDDHIEILSGLTGGERVVRGLEALPPAGARIRQEGS
ncbi:MAG: efflux RND transporter periplasmic adaptor subunit [Acidobacteriota bacterium]